MSKSVYPVRAVLTIGGSDSGGCAGIQADLKTFLSLKVHGCSAITCITSQNTEGVERIDTLPTNATKDQINAISKDIDLQAIKTGMLLNASIIEEVSKEIRKINVPKVIDPVMVSRTGSLLLEKKAISAYKSELFNQAYLLTPNIYEASILSDIEIRSEKDMEKASDKILKMGCQATLIKGGGIDMLKGTDFYKDIDGNKKWLKSKKIDTNNNNGSGCTLSASIASYLALGKSLNESLTLSKAYINKAIKLSLDIGSGSGPLCHWHTFEK
tara:strand:+ start:13915 stop:14724 length:810 start_codon:yes stop_codon:yes gene_type:complete